MENKNIAQHKKKHHLLTFFKTFSITKRETLGKDKQRNGHFFNSKINKRNQIYCDKWKMMLYCYPYQYRIIVSPVLR